MTPFPFYETVYEVCQQPFLKHGLRLTLEADYIRAALEDPMATECGEQAPTLVYWDERAEDDAGWSLAWDMPAWVEKADPIFWVKVEEALSLLDAALTEANTKMRRSATDWKSRAISSGRVIVHHLRTLCKAVYLCRAYTETPLQTKVYSNDYRP